MSVSDFDRSLPKVLAEEGGYVNDPHDRGGETNRGVTQRTYDSWRRARGLRVQSVRYISETEVRSIYRERYWDLIRADRLPSGVNFVVFDWAVNSGVSRAVKGLQQALGKRYAGAIDGIVGPATLQAVEEYPDHDALVDQICDLRMAFLQQIKGWPRYGRGWSARVRRVRALGKAWARGVSDAPIPVATEAGTVKAPPADLAVPPPAAPGDLALGGGTLGAIISQTIGQLTPLQSIASVAQIITWLTVASAAIAIGGIAWRWWVSRRRARIREVSA